MCFDLKFSFYEAPMIVNIEFLNITIKHVTCFPCVYFGLSCVLRNPISWTSSQKNYRDMKVTLQPI